MLLATSNSDGDVSLLHYENLPMQHTENFRGVQIENFHSKNSEIFNMFVQNMDCGYMLERPR